MKPHKYQERAVKFALQAKSCYWKFWNDGYGDGCDYTWYGESAEFKEELRAWKNNRNQRQPKENYE